MQPAGERTEARRHVVRRFGTTATAGGLLAVACVVPFLGLSSYMMSVAVVALVYVVLSQGLNLIYG